MKAMHQLGILLILALAVLLSGCPDARQAIVVNGSSDNASAVDLWTGAVTSDLGGMALGPVPNRIEVVGTTAYVVNSGDFSGANPSLQVIDLSTNTVVNTIPLPDGENPWALAIVSWNKIYVTALYGNNVTIIDPTLQGAAGVLGTIPLPTFGGVPAGPAGIVVHGGYAYTANSGYDAATWGYVAGSVSVIDVSTDTLVDVDGDPGNGSDTPIFTTGLNPQDLAADGEGEIHVVCTGDYGSVSGIVDVIDPASWAVTASIPLGGTPGNISTGKGFALVGAGDADSCDLFLYRTDTHAVLADGSNPFVLRASSGWCTVGKIAVSQSEEWAYVPMGVWGAEAVVMECLLGTEVAVQRVFDLAPGANLPGAVGLVY
jgi:hypothetical protein